MHLDAIDETSEDEINCTFLPFFLFFPATTNSDNGSVQRTDLTYLIEASLFAMGVVLVILGAFSFSQIFLSGVFPSFDLRSAQRQGEDPSLLSNFLSNLDNRYLVYFIKYA